MPIYLLYDEYENSTGETLMHNTHTSKTTQIAKFISKAHTTRTRA